MPLKNSIIFIIFLLISISLFTACPEAEQYPPEPEIEFEQVRLYDSVDLLGNKNKVYRLKFGIIDGDGNIGLKESDTVGIFDPDSLYSDNLFTVLYEIINGDTVAVESDKQRNFRIPYVEPEGQNKTLIADIYADILFSFQGDTLPYDSVYFDFYIVDRDLNKSNVQSTPVLKLDTTGYFPETLPE
ncbi:MAG: hypothetical protein GXO50_05670 [Chlorobi bacterium]|nr:hypothetical protein [Chlorobiota bacterium]